MKAKKIKQQRYWNIYDFVYLNDLHDIALKVLGENWEPEDNLDQISRICEYFSPNQYCVSHILGDTDNYIVVRENDFCDKLVSIEKELETDLGKTPSIAKAMLVIANIKKIIENKNLAYIKQRPTNITTLSSDLRELNQLKDEGILTVGEFNAQKKKLLKQ